MKPTHTVLNALLFAPTAAFALCHTHPSADDFSYLK